MADGVIIGRGVGEGGSEVNNRKRVRERGSPGPSKRHTGSTVKKEELSADARVQRIQALEVSSVIKWLLRLVVSDGSRAHGYACRPN